MTSGCCTRMTTAIWYRRGALTLEAEVVAAEGGSGDGPTVCPADGGGAAAAGRSTGGEGVAVRFVDELIGAYQLLPPGGGRGGRSWPACCPSGGAGIRASSPWDSIIQRCRHMGLLRLRLRCGDDRQRASGEKLGFSSVEGDVMEKDITPRVLDAPSPCEGRKEKVTHAWHGIFAGEPGGRCSGTGITMIFWW